MAVYTPHWAPLVALAFLGTGFVLVVCLSVVLFGVLKKSRSIMAGGVSAGLALLLGYGAVLVGLSLLSRNVDLPQGAWKYFCEIDCHIAYAVEAVQLVRNVGPEMQPLAANKRLLIVQIKSWFDPSTISPQRGNDPLLPNERKLALLDASGGTYEPFSNGQALLAATGLHSTPLNTALRPGESYISYAVFEIPSESSGLRLLLVSADEVSHVLWGHENSPFHKKAYFVLPAV